MQFFNKETNNQKKGSDSKVVPFAKPQSELLSRKEAAAYLGISARTLNVWKCTKRYIFPVVMIGRLVKYRRSDLDKFIEQNTIDVG